ncbi:glucose-6-phosphate dehydrogenase [Dactylosporangium sp. NBC_01737]|uniref:glucose-6-phosphate dehydrogenase n=1 Tax=Dactylosporangium sp. NBC_01737 TaxID=2975959 RepID=UPI002E0FFDC9|nr:glucose-6-phosphate dehydrogenase [Dactylosporangium sp. NBC_01737]
MIQHLAILGATGDLTARYLLPAVGALRAAGHLDERFGLTGLGREDWSDEAFRAWAAEQLDRHAPDLPADHRHWVVAAAQYRRADVTDPGALTTVIPSDRPVAAYLALPPSVFPGAVSALHTAGTADGSTIVLEKPFGESLNDAIELNHLLAERYPERSIFRVDHFLAMATVLNVLGVRLANRVLEPIWSSAHIERVDITWDESLALEGRAGYYDGVGALRDMLQNHLLQLLCLVAMEPPISLGDRDLRDRKMDVLRSIRPLSLHDAAHRTRRARYSAGAGTPAYVDEDGVDAQHHTETYAELLLELDNWRWPGTTFRLRTGKALRTARHEVAVHFRPVPHLPFSTDATAEPNVLRFGLEPESVSLHLTGTSNRGDVLTPLTLAATPEPAELPPYGRLLLDVLHRNPALSIRADEAEESWRVVTPVLDAWAKDLVPLEEYPAGSDGPPPRR